MEKAQGWGCMPTLYQQRTGLLQSAHPRMEGYKALVVDNALQI